MLATALQKFDEVPPKEQQRCRHLRASIPDGPALPSVHNTADLMDDSVI